MKELIEKMSREDKRKKNDDDAEAMAGRVQQELRDAKVRRVHQATDELYIDAGNDEASVVFNPKEKIASVRMVIVRDVNATGKDIAALLKKHGVPF